MAEHYFLSEHKLRPDKGEVGGSSPPRPTINHPVNTRLFSLFPLQGSHYKNHFANYLPTFRAIRSMLYRAL